MIGIFDSGIGGLTVVRELYTQYPEVSFVYLGDSARAPYGDKSKEVILSYAIEDVEFLIDKDIQTILIACNSVSSNCLSELKTKYPQINFLDVITPAVRKVQESNFSKVGIIGTRATVYSKTYDQLLPNVELHSKACPILVPWIEENLLSWDATSSIVDFYLKDMKDVQALILGCTHYPLLKKPISDYLGSHVEVIDPSLELVKSLPQDIIRANTGGERRLFFTDLSDHTSELITSWFGSDIEVAKVNL